MSEKIIGLTLGTLITGLMIYGAWGLVGVIPHLFFIAFGAFVLWELITWIL